MLGILIITTACPANNSNLTRLGQVSDNIATINQGFQIAAQSAHANHLISRDEDIQLQLIVKKVANINDALLASYKKAEANDPTWINSANAALALGADLNDKSLLFIKNENTKATLTAIIVGVRDALDVIALGVKGVKVQ